VLDGGPDPPMGREFFWGKRACHCEVKGYSTVICARTVEPIEVPFRLWARMGPVNHVVDGDLGMLRDVAMATNF